MYTYVLHTYTYPRKHEEVLTLNIVYIGILKHESVQLVRHYLVVVEHLRILKFFPTDDPVTP